MKLLELVTINEVLEDHKSEIYDGTINISHKNLSKISHEYVYDTVTGNFSCFNNQLTSLDGSPRKVGGSFYCSRNNLTSLEGAPQEVGNRFECSSNAITSLKDVHKYIKQIHGTFDARNNPIKSHVLGLLLIEGIKDIQLDNKQVEAILNKYLGQGKQGMIKAQRELIENDLDDFAEI